MFWCFKDSSNTNCGTRRAHTAFSNPVSSQLLFFLHVRSRLTAITSHLATKLWPWNKVGPCILSSGQFVSPISPQFLQSITVISSLLIRDWCVSCSQLVVSDPHHSYMSFAQWYVRHQDCKTGSSSRISSNNNNSRTIILSALWSSNIFIYGYLWEGADKWFHLTLVVQRERQNVGWGSGPGGRPAVAC